MKQYVKKYREAAGLTQQALSNLTGIPLKTIQDWEQKGRSPQDLQRLVPVADVLGCSVDDLLGRRTLPKGAIRAKPVAGVMIPVYGTIAAGTPSEFFEAHYEAEAPPHIMEKHPSAFYFAVSGDSMDREVLNGCLVMIDPDAEIQNGDTVAVNINGNDAALKIINQTSNTIVLSPNSYDPAYKDIVIDLSDEDADEIRIIGKKVWAIYPHPAIINYFVDSDT